MPTAVDNPTMPRGAYLEELIRARALAAQGGRAVPAVPDESGQVPARKIRNAAMPTGTGRRIPQPAVPDESGQVPAPRIRNAAMPTGVTRPIPPGGPSLALPPTGLLAPGAGGSDPRLALPPTGFQGPGDIPGLQDFLDKFGGPGGAGGSSGGFRFSARSGGGSPTAGGSSELGDLVMADAKDNTVLGPDASLRAKFMDLLGQIAANNGKIPELGSEEGAAFDAALAAHKGEIDQQFNDSSDAMIARLFAGGAQQSTVAGDAAGRLLYGRDQLTREMQADDLGARMNARMALLDANMKNYQTQGSLLGEAMGDDLKGVGLRAQQISDNRNRRASLYDNAEDRRTQTGIAEMNMNASSAMAGAQLEASRFNSLVDAWTSSNNLAENRRQFDVGTGEHRREFDMSYRQEDRFHTDDVRLRERGLDLQKREIGVRSRQVALDDAFRRQELDFRKESFGADQMRWGMEFAERQREFDWDYAAGRQDAANGDRRYDQSRDDNERARWEAMFGDFINNYWGDGDN